MAKVEQEKQAASKTELDKQEMALAQEKHEKWMEQQAKFHKTLEANLQDKLLRNPSLQSFQVVYYALRRLIRELVTILE